MVAIYVHFPFCRSLCTYCDFDTFTGRDALIGDYIDAVMRQVESSPRVRASSLYVGGGTPSLMTTGQAQGLMEACRKRFGLEPEAEATLEANPCGLTLAQLEGFRHAGFNRLSLGVQSTDDGLLKLLGRRHRREDVEAIVTTARRAGFDNVSADLIYGVPRQSVSSWRTTLESVVRWRLDHVSCYSLAVEPGTAMERAVDRGIWQVPQEEETVAMYQAAADILAKAGYRRYEISNWALPGFQSSHNLTYWRNQPYLGIGAGAAGCWRGRRYKILPDIEAFVGGVRRGHLALSEDEGIDRRRAMSDTLILGLRLEEGVGVAGFRERYGESPEDSFGDALAWGESWGLLERQEGRLKLTEQGILLSNELFAKLL